MDLTPLGSTGVSLRPVIFGTSALGNLYQAIPNARKLEIVHACFRHVPQPVVFDCAGKYGAGLALETLGRLLNELEIPREKVVISNKLGWLRVPLKKEQPTFEKDVWIDIKHDAVQKISYDGILRCWEQGNDLLGNQYIPQLVSVHDPDEYLSQAGDKKEGTILYKHILEAYKALAELKKSKKAKAVGVGAKNWKIIQRIAADVDLDWVMFANSMTILKHPPDLLEFMEELNQKGVYIINSAVFHAGFLTGGNYFDYRLVQPDSEENRKLFAWRKNFFALCREHSVKPADACVQFARTAPGVKSISLNTSNPERIKDNVDSVSSDIPEVFWEAMMKNGVISPKYPYLAVD